MLTRSSANAEEPELRKASMGPGVSSMRVSGPFPRLRLTKRPGSGTTTIEKPRFRAPRGAPWLIRTPAAGVPRAGDEGPRPGPASPGQSLGVQLHCPAPPRLPAGPRPQEPLAQARPGATGTRRPRSPLATLRQVAPQLAFSFGEHIYRLRTPLTAIDPVAP